MFNIVRMTSNEKEGKLMTLRLNDRYLQKFIIMQPPENQLLSADDAGREKIQDKIQGFIQSLQNKMIWKKLPIC